ncbi:hypothetical protein Hanom_Chr01g00079871 [Helianthus anomalus]
MSIRVRFSSDSGYISDQVRFDSGSVNLSMFGLVRVLVSGQQWFRVNDAFGLVRGADQIACFAVHYSLNFDSVLVRFDVSIKSGFGSGYVLFGFGSSQLESTAVNSFNESQPVNF